MGKLIILRGNSGSGKTTVAKELQKKFGYNTMLISQDEMEPSMESEKFILTDKPHSTIRKEGFPLDSISLDIKTNKYYYDLPEDKLEQLAVEDGFLEFFKNILNLN